MTKIQSLLYNEEQVKFLNENVFQVVKEGGYDVLNINPPSSEEVGELFNPSLKLFRTKENEELVVSQKNIQWLLNMRPIVSTVCSDRQHLIVNNDLHDIENRWRVTLLHMYKKGNQVHVKPLQFKRDINLLRAPLSVIIRKMVGETEKSLRVTAHEIYETFLSQFELCVVIESSIDTIDAKGVLQSIYRKENIERLEDGTFILNLE